MAVRHMFGHTLTIEDHGLKKAPRRRFKSRRFKGSRRLSNRVNGGLAKSINQRKARKEICHKFVEADRVLIRKHYRRNRLNVESGESLNSFNAKYDSSYHTVSYGSDLERLQYQLFETKDEISSSKIVMGKYGNLRRKYLALYQGRSPPTIYREFVRGHTSRNFVEDASWEMESKVADICKHTKLDINI